MKIVEWVDEQGFKHKSLLRDQDPDRLAPSGVPLDPPDLNRLDWEGLKRELHNLLLEKGLRTWKDVQKSQNGVTSSIVTVFKRPIISLYKSEE